MNRRANKLAARRGGILPRTWARGVVTTYSYDGWNSLTNTAYSDGTPTVSLMYDALGRQTNAVDAVGLTKLTYDACGSLVREKVSGLYSKTLQRHYDDFGRGTGYTIDSTRMTKVEYEEDTGRVHGIKSGAVWMYNRYLAGTDLRDRIKYGSSGYTYYTYEESRDLLAQVRSVFGGETISQYDYANDALGRRTEIARSGTAMSETRADAYGYNDRNELVSAAKTGGPGVVPADEYDYLYDDIGNRLSSFDLGTNHTYTANNLNQYTQISNLCDYASLGTRFARLGRFPMGRAHPQGADTREEFIPQYDLDGNQTLVKTSTGIWSVTYNGENRPVSWTCGPTNVVMSFDRMGRRVSYLETVSGGSQSPATVTNGNYNFVYDGYLCIQRIHGATKNVKLIFTWDPLETVATKPLMVEKPGSYKMHVTHDGNKNVSELVFFGGVSGIAAHYEYAPFGAVTVSTKNTSVYGYDFRTYNPFRFSSEYADDTLGLVYYNYRHYNPVDGRWTSRDPLGDREICYVFCRNKQTFDFRGLLLGEIVDFVVDGVADVGKAVGTGIVAAGKAVGTGIKAVGEAVFYSGKVVMNCVGAYFIIPASIIDGEFINDVIYEDIARGVSFDDVTGCTIVISVNGMANKDGDELAQRLRDVLKEPAKPFHNPSNFAIPYVSVGVGDVVQSLVYELGLQDTASVGLADVISQAYDRLKSNGCKNPCIKVYAHSQGTMLVRRAFDWLKYSPFTSSAPLGCITFCGYGGETSIDKSEFGLRDSENMLNFEDPIKWLSPRRWGDDTLPATEDESGHRFIYYIK